MFEGLRFFTALRMTEDWTRSLRGGDMIGCGNDILELKVFAGLRFFGFAALRLRMTRRWPPACAGVTSAAGRVSESAAKF